MKNIFFPVLISEDTEWSSIQTYFKYKLSHKHTYSIQKMIF